MEGRIVGLRDLTDEDLPLLVRWQNDPEIARWMDYRTPVTLEDVEADQRRATAEGHPFIVTYEGRAVGKAGLNQFRKAEGRCALYLYIGEKALWGRGLGRDAVMALLTIAFERLGVDEVELTMLPGNERAKRIYEACGFLPDGEGSGVRSGRLHVMRLNARSFRDARQSHGF